MVWASKTEVARVACDAKDGFWGRVCKTANASEKVGVAVCCFFLKGNCVYSKTCGFSHDASLAPSLGCQYGDKCKEGHRATKTPGQNEVAPAVPILPVVDEGIMEEARLAPDSIEYLECLGPDFDDTDPLWEEVVCAVLEDGEDNGDSDLPEVTRNRLATDGRYRLVDADTQDEWLCLPGEWLKARSDSDIVRRRRAEWLCDELREVKTFWEQVSLPWRTELQSTDTAMQRLHAAAAADAALRRISQAALEAEAPDANDNGGDPEIAVRNAAEAALGALHCELTTCPEDIHDGFEDLRRCLGRCAFLARARCAPSGRSLAALAQRAASTGDFVLVHHVVPWAGDDAEELKAKRKASKMASNAGEAESKRPKAAGDKAKGPAGNPKYRQEGCWYYVRGICTQGDDCYFSHEAEKLAQVKKDW